MNTTFKKILQFTMMATAIAFVLFIIGAMIYYKPARKTINTKSISYTSVDDRKRGALLKNNEDGSTNWHYATKRCQVNAGETKNINLYTYQLIDRDGNVVKTYSETDMDEVSKAFCH